MDSGMIGKIQKAKRYAEEPERMHIQALTVTIDGENTQNNVSYQSGSWNCTCNFFHTRGRCSHTMALEIVLEKMLS